MGFALPLRVQFAARRIGCRQSGQFSKESDFPPTRGHVMKETKTIDRLLIVFLVLFVASLFAGFR